MKSAAIIGSDGGHRAVAKKMKSIKREGRNRASESEEERRVAYARIGVKLMAAHQA